MNQDQDLEIHGPEIPISSINDDLFGRDRFIEGLEKALIGKNGKATGVVLGITGKWGSGKTSTINMLRERIEKNEHAVVVNFNPWLISGKHDLINQFFAELCGVLKNEEYIRRFIHYNYRLPEVLSSYAGTISSIANHAVHGSGLFAKTSLEILKNLILRDQTICDLRKEIERELQRVDFPIVVIIDELDRVENDEVKTVAQLIKGVADFPNVSYLVSYDKDRVIEALGAPSTGYYGNKKACVERGRVYLEKIIQYSVELPILLPAQLEDLAVKGINEIVISSELRDGDDYRKRLGAVLKSSIPELMSTPRDVKRALGMFRVLAGFADGEVDWVDIFGLSVIQVKAPMTYRWISENYHELIVDSDILTIRQKRKQYKLGGDVEDMISQLVVQEPGLIEKLRKLLELLFPTLTSRGGYGADKAYDGPLSKRRNMLIMLRHGLYDGNISRKDVVEFLNFGLEDRCRILKSHIASNTISDFLDIFENVYSHFDGVDDRKLWIDISIFFDRYDSNNYRYQKVLIVLSDSFRDMFFRLCGEGKRLSGLSDSIIRALVERGDFSLAPGILRDNVFKHGLFSVRKQDGVIYCSQEETERLSHVLCNRLVSAIISDVSIIGFFDISAFFLLVNLSLLSTDIRSILTAFIGSDNGLLRFCMLFLRPHHYIERDILNKFVDVSLLESRLTNFDSSVDGFEREIVDFSISRLNANDKW